MQNAARLYGLTDIKAKTEEQTPEQIVIALYEKACSVLYRATMLPMDKLEELQLTERLATIEDFHKSVSKAIQIILTLRSILDMEQGGEVSRQLSETYTVIANSILRASRPPDLTEIKKLYDVLRDCARWL